MINTEKLFAQLKYFFKDPNKVIDELLQNARRAGATEVHLDIKDHKIIYKDNGKGMKDPEALVTLASSEWDQDIMDEENPAGWGLFFLYAIAEDVKIKSRFGSLSFNCQNFLTREAYRNAVLENIRPDSCDGMMIEAEIMDEPYKEIRYFEFNYDYLNKGSLYPFRIIYNGKEVEDLRKRLDALLDDHVKVDYEGNLLYVQRGWRDLEDVAVVWHGAPFVLNRYHGWSNFDLLLVDRGSPVNMVLPYRDKIKEDEKYKRLVKFANRIRKKEAVKIINTGKGDSNLAHYAVYLSNSGGREYVERCKVWPIVYKYGSLDGFNINTDEIELLDTEHTVRKIDRATIEIKEDGKKPLIFDFPADNGYVIWSTGLPLKKVNPKYDVEPSWIEEDAGPKKKVEIKILKSAPFEYGKICKAEITIDGKKVENAAIYLDLWDEKLFDCEYLCFTSEDALDAITEYVVAHCFNEEGDTWDTQEYYIRKNIKEALRKINGKPDVYEFLCELVHFVDPPYDRVTISKKDLTICKGNKRIVFDCDTSYFFEKKRKRA
uniref:ATP-binding protein n=1 Tax=Dictyoglomus turgidum TaxID=513050 RepID=A0A7C3SRD5_9BACT